MSCMLQNEPHRHREEEGETEIVRSVPGERCLPLAHTLEWDAKETVAERQKREGGREKSVQDVGMGVEIK